MTCPAIKRLAKTWRKLPPKTASVYIDEIMQQFADCYFQSTGNPDPAEFQRHLDIFVRQLKQAAFGDGPGKGIRPTVDVVGHA